ncbi:SAP domain-containing protein [Amycolatopsis sp. WQ 127309]|uniref:SAP domain-containing protein n=1 Tax=Amycolatopsis sp. WQ 127309 TaxID=2932773 RepID=UPI001FF40092|nr:SAP domain-containing protein [Amycolatopsis sp. WQ 127309]UOZ10540.1 SAP domain-containing protein [Amycolatopsis sp. WQ 127309]
MPKITRAGGPSNEYEVQPQDDPSLDGKFFQNSDWNRPADDAAESSEETDSPAEPVDYSDWTAADLSAELERRELPKSGTKPELLARLEADDAKDE